MDCEASVGVKSVNLIATLLKKMTRIQLALGGSVLVAMIVLTCANIFLRQLGLPIRGTFELMGFMGALIFALSLGYSSEKKEHIYVSILFHRLPIPFQRGAKLLSDLISLLFFGLLSFQLVKNGLNLKVVEEVSETLRIPYYPVVIVVALGTGFLSLQFIFELTATLRNLFNAPPSSPPPSSLPSSPGDPS